MAVFHLSNAYVEVNSVDLSDHVTSVTIEVAAEELDATAMSAEGWQSKVGGLRNWSVQINFHQDFDAGQVDATIWPLLGTVAAVKVKPVNDTVSATNPAYVGDVLVNAYSPVANGVGELATVQVTWPGSGPLVREVEEA